MLLRSMVERRWIHWMYIKIFSELENELEGEEQEFDFFRETGFER